MRKLQILTQNDIAILIEEANDAMRHLQYGFYVRDQDGKIQMEMWRDHPREDDELLLANLQNPPREYDLSRGTWQEKTLEYYCNDLTIADLMNEIPSSCMQDMKDVFLYCLKMDGYALSDDIPETFIKQILASSWMNALDCASRLLEIKKDAGLPAYLPESDNIWYVWIDGHLEYGGLVYVVSEYVNSGLCFDYDYTDSHKDDNWQDHAHEFEGVLAAILENPAEFTVKGHEKDYSQQELELIEQFQRKLLEDQGESNHPTKIHRSNK